MIYFITLVSGLVYIFIGSFIGRLFKNWRVSECEQCQKYNNYINSTGRGNYAEKCRLDHNSAGVWFGTAWPVSFIFAFIGVGGVMLIDKIFSTAFKFADGFIKSE